jgi:hypothetical protein
MQMSGTNYLLNNTVNSACFLCVKFLLKQHVISNNKCRKWISDYCLISIPDPLSLELDLISRKFVQISS